VQPQVGAFGGGVDVEQQRIEARRAGLV